MVWFQFRFSQSREMKKKKSNKIHTRIELDVILKMTQINWRLTPSCIKLHLINVLAFNPFQDKTGLPNKTLSNQINLYLSHAPNTTDVDLCVCLCVLPVSAPGEGLGAVGSVSCGQDHSVAVCASGQVYSWGAGGEGQLGITPTTVSKVLRPRQGNLNLNLK